MTNQKEELKRSLKERHIQLIALGGAIGVGLFLGSSNAIQTAGPAVLLSYLIGGLAIFVIMRALGELAIAYPVAGSFSTYAHEFLGPMYGYVTGWTYWFMWIVTCMAEITAVGIYMTYWYPESPQWVWALMALCFMTASNLIGVEKYGEFEFWFALIKIITIIALLVIGGGIIFFGIGTNGHVIGLSNLYNNGGFFAKGFSGPILALVTVAYAYLGIELIGVTAGEAENPEKTLPRAINGVLWRIIIFYVGAIFVILCLYPWNKIGTQGSPFVLTFNKIGITKAAGIINFVVLTAALSSCNSGVFSTGRMLFNLANQGDAPQFLRKLNKAKVPVNGVLVSAVVLLTSVALNYLTPGKLFKYITEVASLGAIWVWAIILISQIKYRQNLSTEELNSLKYKTPLYPYASYLALAFLGLVVCMLGLESSSRISLYIGIAWFTCIIFSYYIRRKEE